MDEIADQWQDTREFLETVTKSFETTLDSAEYLQRTGREYVRRCSRPMKQRDLPSTASTWQDAREFQETYETKAARTEEWRKLLFQRNCPVEFENEPRWYKVLNSYRPSRSLYEGLGLFNAKKAVMVNACVQTDFTFVRKCHVLGMESFEFEKEEKRSGTWKMCCCGRQ